MCTRVMQDGTYAVWQRMVKANVGSDEITQRLLAVAFGNNPQMANALVHEAKCIQASCQSRLQQQG